MLDRVHLRTAEPDDFAELAALAYLSWEAGILPLLADRPGLRDSERRRFAGYVAEATPRIILASHDDEIVGWCSRAQGRAYIPYLFVIPYMQNTGIGSALLARTESILELMNYDRVFLDAPADHTRAVSFYQHQGYRILAMGTEGRGNIEPLQSVRLEKRLSPYRGRVGET